MESAHPKVVNVRVIVYTKVMTNIRALTAEEMKSFMPVRARLLGASSNIKSKGYYSEAAFRVKPVAAEGLGTWAVDKNWRLYIDPATLPNGELGWNVAQCASVFEHELNHLLRDHGLRMETFGGKTLNTEKSNIATDLEINDDMDADSFVAEIGVLPSKMGLPNNKTAEWYYNNMPSQDDDGDGDSDGDDKDSKSNNGNEGNGKPKLGSCGSGAGGKPIDGELEADSEIAPSVSEGEAKIIRQSTAQAVQQHEQQYGRGTVAGGLSEWAELELAPPTVPWQRILRSAIRQGVRMAAGNTDHTYTRLSRRASAYKGFAFPAMHSPKPLIAAVVDTSASMSVSMIHEALNEVQGIANKMGCSPDEITLIQVDSEVSSIEPFSDARKVQISGRGGTDLRKGISAALEMRKTPNVIVVLTDGDTPYPDKPIKGTKLIVGIVGDSNYKSAAIERAKSEIPWATIVQVGEAA